MTLDGVVSPGIVINSLLLVCNNRVKKRELLLVKIKTFIYARILVLLIYLFFSLYNFTQFFNPGVNQHWREDVSDDLIVFLSLEAFISKIAWPIS